MITSFPPAEYRYSKLHLKFPANLKKVPEKRLLKTVLEKGEKYETLQCFSVGKTVWSSMFHNVSLRKVICKHPPLHLCSPVNLLYIHKDTGLLHQAGDQGFGVSEAS
jgi:hypothetical protein